MTKISKKKLTFHIITLFPESLSSYLNESIIARAQKEGRIEVRIYNPRDYVEEAKVKRGKDSYGYRHVDDRPYGGGPGMVIQALPVAKAIEKAVGKKLKTPSSKKKVKIIFLAPQGKQFTTDYAKEVSSKFSDIVIVCGRYEGVDARIAEMFSVEAVTIGPYVLTGGELPALIILDSVARQVPGVLGKIESLEETRISSTRVYTRPEVIVWKKKKYHVPPVLLSGHEKKIKEWKQGEGNVL